MLRQIVLILFTLSYLFAGAVDRDSLSFLENKRIGVSWFERGKYLKAIQHLEKSYDFFEGDSLLNSYLYHSYQNMNRDFEKNSLYSNLSSVTKDYFKIDEPKPVYSSYFEIGGTYIGNGDWGNWNSRNLNEWGVNCNVSLSQNIKNRWLIRHKLTANYQSGDIELNLPFSDITTYDERYKMLSYSPVVTFFKNRSLSFSFYAHLMYENYKGIDGVNYVVQDLLPDLDTNDSHSNQFDYWQDRDDDDELDDSKDFDEFPNYDESLNGTYEVNTYDQSFFNFLVGTSFSYNISQVQIGGAFSYLNFFNKNAYQLGVNGVFYPTANLNLYFILKFYYLWRNVLSDVGIGSHNPLIEGMIGFKIAPAWWMQLSYLYGDSRCYNDEDTHTLFLFDFTPKYRVSMLNIFPINEKFSLNLSYHLIAMDKTYYGLQNFNWVELQNKSIGHYLSIGLLWKY